MTDPGDLDVVALEGTAGDLPAALMRRSGPIVGQEDYGHCMSRLAGL